MIIRPGSPEAAILALIRRRGQVSAVEIGTACRMTPGDVRSRLVTLESMRLVSGCYNKSTPPRRIYALTGEGARMILQKNGEA